MLRRHHYIRLVVSALAFVGLIGILVAQIAGVPLTGLAFLTASCAGAVIYCIRSVSQGLEGRVDRASDLVKQAAAIQAADGKELAASTFAATLLTRRFPGVYMPVSSYSMNPANIMVVLELLEEVRPARVVELGSGISTLYIAAWLREQGRGRLTSFDHDEQWSERCRKSLVRAGLCDLVDLHGVALASAGSDRSGWYELAAHEAALSDIDVLIVDGPPAGLDPISRLPALGYFYGRLARNAVVFLDDASRDGEQEVVRRWALNWPDLCVEFRHTLTGCYILRKGIGAVGG